MTIIKPSFAAWRALRGAAAIAVLSLSVNAAFAVTIAHWDFETDLIAGSAVSGQNVSHPSINGAFDAAIPDISGNGNDLSAFSIDGSGFAVMQFSDVVSPSNRTGSTLSITGAPGDCCEVLNSQGDLDLGGSPVGALAAWTIEASVNFFDAGGWQTIVGKDGFGQATNGDGNQAPLYFQKKGDGTEQFRINYVDVLGNAHILDSVTTAQANKWYNLAATNDGSTLRLYVNGIGETSLDLTATSADTRMVALDESGFAGDDLTSDSPYAWTVARGMYNDGHGDRVNGYIDDVRISNAALTVSELLNNTIDSLSLVVNTATGVVSIRNDSNDVLSFDYYRVDSPTNGDLSPGAWNSLSDQGVDSIGPNPGESWDEATNAISVNRLVEEFLLGDTTLAPGHAVSLGNAYTGGVSSDLEFQVGFVADGALTGAKVVYTTATGLPGDFNGNGSVDAADYTIWRDNQGSESNLAADASGNGRVDQADYNIWAANYGNTMPPSVAIPEPAALAVAALACLVAFGRARR
ncbi:hypothetical protein Pla108_40420 [Botrimarina colliarenosi]|uniref:LamG-like jellyroll fold domain-containing protein n=1 Tax=Botrimarina colliarenosi TaxID=2528001 RepID=A0A5C5ZZ99_9BACT|nr:LamG-like jellyroll fold domain-containing protein [Botrimarina colliarenosi]TWT92902.1 hypothetical protein Pla108_40420 [Botrimarina colliarenosi]